MHFDFSRACFNIETLFVCLFVHSYEQQAMEMFNIHGVPYKKIAIQLFLHADKKFCCYIFKFAFNLFNNTVFLITDP